MASVVERDRGEARRVECPGEAVVSAGVLGRTVRDEHNAPRLVDGPPATEHLDAMRVDERVLTDHRALLDASLALRCFGTSFRKRTRQE